VKAIAVKFSSGPDKSAALECAPELAIMNSFVLPAETPEVLQAIVRNKVEGFAPWPLARSAVGQRIRAIAGDEAHVMADAVVVSRGLLEDCASALSAYGISVRSAAVRLADGDLAAVEFGGSEAQRQAERGLVRAAALTGALATCAMAVGLFFVWQAMSEASHYRAQTSALMARIQGEASGEEGSALVAAANRLYTERIQRQPAVAVLNELSRLLPASAWLDSVALDNDKIEMKGQATDVPALISILEEAAIFRDVNFASATQANAGRSADAFAIEAVLENGPAEAAP
jgi:general secretion pathway protein L